MSRHPGALNDNNGVGDGIVCCEALRMSGANEDVVLGVCEWNDMQVCGRSHCSEINEESGWMKKTVNG